MSLNASHIAKLYYHAQADTLTVAERSEWEDFRRQYPAEAEQLLTLEDQDIAALFINRSPASVTSIRDRMLADIHARMKQEGGEVVPAVHPDSRPKVPVLRTAWLRYAAAIIILFGIGAYLWNNNKNHPQTNTTTIKPVSSDILPGGQRATLTLADGRQIILDSAANGQIAVENGSEVVKRGGEIIYDADRIKRSAVSYNTMSTPRGGQYQLTLHDGTKVWLNAASSITYPTAFTGNTREVTIVGEAYFEVKADKERPFIVKTLNDEITVLGTSFNVNAYPDEIYRKTSLIEGKIKVGQLMLQPSQAYVNGKVITTNIQQDIAWKNGLFNFEGEDLKTVMRQIERWYDIKVSYAPNFKGQIIGGKMQRSFTLGEVMEALSAMGIRYTLNNKNLTIE